MKKIIIFGATGNAGAYVVDYCLKYFDKSQYEVIATGRRETDYFTKRGIPYYSVDVSKAEQLEKLPTENVYAVLLLAAQIPSYMKGYNPSEYINSNIIGAFNVLEYCRKVKADRIIYTHTVFDVSLSVNQETPIKPDFPRNFGFSGDHAVYVISKNTAVDLVEHYHQEYGIKRFIFRLPTIYNYSPYQYYYPAGVKKMRPIYQMINKAMNSEPIEIWGDPEYSKDMVHVNDISQMLCKAVEVNRSGGFYNAGTGIPVTMREEIESIIAVFSPPENPSKIILCPEKLNSGAFLMDVSNAKEELGYKPQYNCLDLFKDYKVEMELNRYKELREI